MTKRKEKTKYNLKIISDNKASASTVRHVFFFLTNKKILALKLFSSLFHLRSISAAFVSHSVSSGAAPAATRCETIAERIEKSNSDQKQKSRNKRHEDDKPRGAVGVFKWFDFEDIVDGESNGIRHNCFKIGI